MRYKVKGNCIWGYAKKKVEYHCPTQWIPGAVSIGVKLQKREANHSSPSIADDKNFGATVRFHNMPSWRATYLTEVQK
jgi:hypothetical protein